MSDSFDSLELPDELRDVASQLRGLRPAAGKASQAECMYRAGWEAALAANAPPAPSLVQSWNKSYFGGLISGAVVAGALTASLMLGVAGNWKAAEAVHDAGSLAREMVEPASDSQPTENLANQLAGAQQSAQASAQPPVQALRQRRDSAKDNAASVPALTDDLRASALLSPVGRHQWREILTQAAAPYALPRDDSAPTSLPRTEPLRSSPRNIDRTWF